jgi:hypothetical protein
MQLLNDSLCGCKKMMRAGANALVLLDEGWSCQHVAHALILDGALLCISFYLI